MLLDLNLTLKLPIGTLNFVRHFKICPRVTGQPKCLRNKMKETNEIKS